MTALRNEQRPGGGPGAAGNISKPVGLTGSYFSRPGSDPSGRGVAGTPDGPLPVTATPPSPDAPRVQWARYYAGLGLRLCAIPPGCKGPRSPAWPDHPLPPEHWEAHPGEGIGAILGASGLVSLDLDALPETRALFSELGLDLDTLLGGAALVRGHPERLRALYRAPLGVELSRRVLEWPAREPGGKPVTVFELRAGRVQDVLPPTTHPDTGQPYEWVTPPAVLATLAEPPPELLELWTQWESWRPMLEGLCPWAAPEESAPAPRGPGARVDVIGAFNQAHDVRALLEAYGYHPKGRNRWTAPSSESGIPGVVRLESGRVYSHHGADPLADGHAHDAFDVFRLLEHGGDTRAAVRAAAEALEIQDTRVSSVLSPPTGRFQDAHIPLRSLEKEGQESARAFYLEAWNGTGRFTFDRIGRGTVEIDAACVSILGGIQPGPLSDYLESAFRGGAGDDGLIQRFQLLVWPDVSSEWRNVDRWPDTDAKQRAWRVFERVDGLDPHAIRAEQDSPDSLAYLRFAAAAQDELDRWREDLERRLRNEESPAVEAHLAKYRSLIPSVALVFHLADHAEGGPVGPDALLRACAWGEYLETHARRLYSQVSDARLLAAHTLDRHIVKGDLPAEFRERDVYRKNWRNLDSTTTRPALELLAELDRVRLAPDPPGPGRPSARWQINPKLLRTAP